MSERKHIGIKISSSQKMRRQILCIPSGIDFFSLRKYPRNNLMFWKNLLIKHFLSFLVPKILCYLNINQRESWTKLYHSIENLKLHQTILFSSSKSRKISERNATNMNFACKNLISIDFRRGKGTSKSVKKIFWYSQFVEHQILYKTIYYDGHFI